MNAKIHEFTEHTVVKTNSPARLRAEAYKTMQAHDIGADSGLFRAPKVLDFDEHRRRLVLERLRDITPLRLALRRTCDAHTLIDKVAASLALVHNQLELPKEMLVPLPNALTFPGTNTVLHGDLSVNNVFLTRHEPGLAILDWQTTQQVGGGATCGTPYFDVVWFISNVFRAMCTWDTLQQGKKDAMSAARRFMKHYLVCGNQQERVEDVVAYMKQFFPYRFKQTSSRRHWRKSVLAFPARRAVLQFINTPQLATDLLQTV